MLNINELYDRIARLTDQIQLNPHDDARYERGRLAGQLFEALGGDLAQARGAFVDALSQRNNVVRELFLAYQLEASPANIALVEQHYATFKTSEERVRFIRARFGFEDPYAEQAAAVYNLL